MIDSPSASIRSSRRRRPWLVVAAAATALGLLTAVAADGPGQDPDAPRTTDDEAVYRRLVNEGYIPRPSREGTPDAPRPLVNEGQIPVGALQ